MRYLLFLILFPLDVGAVCFMDSGGKAFDKSDLVFEGRVIEIVEVPNRTNRLLSYDEVYEVKEVYKGESLNQVKLRGHCYPTSEPATCSKPSKIGQENVVYAIKNESKEGSRFKFLKGCFGAIRLPKNNLNEKFDNETDIENYIKTKELR